MPLEVGVGEPSRPPTNWGGIPFFQEQGRRWQKNAKSVLAPSTKGVLWSDPSQEANLKKNNSSGGVVVVKEEGMMQCIASSKALACGIEYF